MNFPTGVPIIVVAFLWVDEFPPIGQSHPHIHGLDSWLLVLTSSHRVRFRPVDDR
jgi:hypothetical protein